MAKLTSYTFISLNGFYKGQEDDISWHHHGNEEADYSAESLKSGNTLLFGRITYEMMQAFWPTKMAYDSFPVVADGMNKAEKIVFSKRLKSSDWAHTTVSSELIDKVVELKKTGKNDLTLLGSGTVMTQLAGANLIDEYQIMVDPVVLGGGTPVFHNIEHQLDLRLTKSKTFNSGVILLHYKPLYVD